MAEETVNLFNRNDLFKINWDEIIFDVLLVVYAEFFLYKILAGDRWFVEIFNVDIFMLIGVMIDFFIIWYLGLIFFRYKDRTGNYLIMAAVVIVSVWIVGSLHMGMAMNIGDIFPDDIFMKMAVYGLMLVMVGIGGGMVFAMTEVKALEGKPVVRERVGALKKLFPIGFAVYNIYAAYHIMRFLDFRGFAAGFIIWLLLTGSIVLFFIILDKAIKEKKPGNMDKFQVFKRILFPVIVVTLLCLWDEIYLWGKISPALREKETVSTVGMFFYLLFAGIIPMRLLLIFQPPVSLISLGTGLVSLVYFIASVHNLLQGLF